MTEGTESLAVPISFDFPPTQQDNDDEDDEQSHYISIPYFPAGSGE